MGGMRIIPSGRFAEVRRLAFATALVAASAVAAAPASPKFVTAVPNEGGSPVVSEDVPVPGGLAALARALGIDAPDRARCVAELTRLTYADVRANRARSGSTFRHLVAYFEDVGRTPSAADVKVATDRVPMPLPAAVWSQAVFHRPVPPADLFAAVMSDAAAALLAHGLAALDDETLRFFVEHPAVVARLYERDAAVFGVFAAHLQIRNNRVVPPGGDRAVPLWEALLGEKVSHPEGFVRELFARDKGRLAYLYDTIGHLDPSRAAFGLGLWMDAASLRADRFRALALAVTESFHEWDITKLPFSRPAHDLQTLLSRMHVTATGAPGFPGERWMWAAAFGSDDLSEPLPRGPEKLDGQRVDAAWLAEILLPGHSRWRMERLDQFAFGQRVFGAADAAALPDLLVAIRTFPRFRMLMLTLERIGVRDPRLYAALAGQAQRLSALRAVRGRPALAQFQGAIALIARLERVKSIDRPAAEALLGTLADLPFDRERGYRGAFAPWLRLQLRPALRSVSRNGVESVLLEALAGARGRIPVRRVSWEGQDYQFDVVASETERLRRFRARQGGPSIDLALDLHRIAQKLPARAAERVFELVDMVLGDALVSLSYAVEWADRQTPRGLTRNVARHHDFGFTKTSAEARVRTSWALPGLMFDSGTSWRVEGALLGLDVALAPLAVRRINADPPASAPTIGSPERDTFVASLGLMNPFTLKDADRDAIADAVARGQQRVDALAGDGGDVMAIAREIAMDGWRVRALRWSLAHDRPHVASLFTMTDLLYLGGGRDLDLRPWGMSGMKVLGCICTHMPAPGLHTAFQGRAHLGLLATTVADLNLRVAVTLRELRLPAALAKVVLASAVQELVDQVKPIDADDWLAFVRAAQGVSRERIEDYVAAATAGGPLMPSPPPQAVRWP